MVPLGESPRICALESASPFVPFQSPRREKTDRKRARLTRREMRAPFHRKKRRLHFTFLRDRSDNGIATMKRLNRPGVPDSRSIFGFRGTVFDVIGRGISAAQAASRCAKCTRRRKKYTKTGISEFLFENDIMHPRQPSNGEHFQIFERFRLISEMD